MQGLLVGVVLGCRIDKVGKGIPAMLVPIALMKPLSIKPLGTYPAYPSLSQYLEI